jgi:hypothetical protein
VEPSILTIFLYADSIGKEKVSDIKKNEFLPNA